MNDALARPDLRGHEEERALGHHGATEDDTERQDVGEDFKDSDDDPKTLLVHGLGARVLLRRQHAEHVPSLRLHVASCAAKRGKHSFLNRIHIK